MNRYIIGILALFGLAILLVVLLFTGGSPKSSQPKTTNFSSYVYSDSEVEMVVDGPIVADQDHNTVKVIVNAKTATFNLIEGYDGNVINAKDFNNNINSYKSFMYAIYYAGFTSGQTSSYSSDIGLCPDGSRFDYYLYNDGQTVQHYWVTNCANTAKTYVGNQGLTSSLFEAQIPNFGTLVGGANISGL